jgi:hypothetical protein
MQSSVIKQCWEWCQDWDGLEWGMLEGSDETIADLVAGLEEASTFEMFVEAWPTDPDLHETLAECFEHTQLTVEERQEEELNN